ncbi:MAG: NYN domain-containing protein [Betaproteobacteria bacterium]
MTRADTVKVWRVVEKKTDVNLALRMYRDACRGDVDQAVLVSNDSDAEPTLRALAEDFPSVRLGVVMPLPHPVEGDKSGGLSGGRVGFFLGHGRLIATLGSFGAVGCGSGPACEGVV